MPTVVLYIHEGGLVDRRRQEKALIEYVAAGGYATVSICSEREHCARLVEQDYAGRVVAVDHDPELAERLGEKFVALRPARAPRRERRLSFGTLIERLTSTGHTPRQIAYVLDATTDDVREVLRGLGHWRR